MGRLSRPFGALAALYLAACTVYDESLLLDDPARGGSSNNGSGGGEGEDAGNAGGGGAPAGGTSSCMPFQAPAKSSEPDAPGGNLPPLTFAMRRINLGDDTPDALNPPTRFLDVGFDLDDLCTTTQNALVECVLPEGVSPTRDGRDGIDNALGSVIQGVRNRINDFSSENYTEALEHGNAGILLRIIGWNGEANDSQVRIETYVTAPYDAFEEGREPNWDGNDDWPIASDTLIDDDINRPRTFDDNGYVVDYKVVGNPIRSVLRLDVNLGPLAAKLNMELSGSSTVCELRESSDFEQGWVARNCLLGGVWEADALLKQLSQFPDVTQMNAPLCTTNDLYPDYKKEICGRIDSFNGRPSPVSVCDAISIGVAFEADPAVRGQIYVLDPPAERCPEGADPSADSCFTPTPGLGDGGT